MTFSLERAVLMPFSRNEIISRRRIAADPLPSTYILKNVITGYILHSGLHSFTNVLNNEAVCTRRRREYDAHDAITRRSLRVIPRWLLIPCFILRFILKHLRWVGGLRVRFNLRRGKREIYREIYYII